MNHKPLPEWNKGDYRWDVWDASSFTGLSERTVQRKALAMGAAIESAVRASC